MHSRKGTKDGEIIRRLYRSSVTSIIISAVAAMFGVLIDGIVIGRFLGTDSMAAYGIVSPLFSIITAISGILAAGSQVYCAKYLGAGRTDRARQVFSVCMAVTVLISIVLTTLVFVLCNPLCISLGAQGQTAHLLPFAKDYLYGISPGILPVLLLFVFNSLMRLDGDPNRVVAAVVAMTVCDVAGDLLNALVLHGGMLGMGISTAISYWVALVIMLMHFRQKDIIFRFSMKNLQMSDLIGIFKIGAPTAVGSGSAMLRVMIQNHIMAAVAGSTAVAALSVRNTLNNLFGSILIGVGMTTAMVAGMVYGEEDRNSAKHLLAVSLRFAIGIGILLAAISFAGAPKLVAMFASGKPDSVNMSVQAIRAMHIYALGLPFYGINMVFTDYLQGINRLKLANLVSLFDNLVFVCAISLSLSPAIKADAVWLSYPVGEILTIITVVFMAYREKKTIPRKLEDLLFLPDDFGAEEGEVYEITLETIGETVEASHEVASFMKERGATRKEAGLVPLFIEEMAGNVIEHGFTKDQKKHSVDVRVLKKQDRWIIRIRDNCVSFDPLQRATVYDPKDPAANIGIRMVTGMAEDIQYINAMQLNNLIIRI